MNLLNLNEIADNFRIRASAAGQLATNDRSGKKMGKTAQGYIETYVKEALYGRRKEFASKYTDKGLDVEQGAIDYLANARGEFYVKNTERKTDDYFTGEADLVHTWRSEIEDIKSSWDCFTFPLFESDLPSKDYFYQGQIYMHLWGLNKARFTYVLMNTPDDIAEREIWRKIGSESIFDESMLEQYRYDNVPAELRVKSFAFDYDPTVIEFLQNRVEEARDYIRTLKF